MARKITFQQAVNEALDQEMARDESVIIMGEDVVGGAGTEGEMDAWGGVLGITKGLYGKYGDRIMDTPISELGGAGIAVGAAMTGLRPIYEFQFSDFAAHHGHYDLRARNVRRLEREDVVLQDEKIRAEARRKPSFLFFHSARIGAGSAHGRDGFGEVVGDHGCIHLQSAGDLVGKDVMHPANRLCFFNHY